jgi:hypothetical protein
MSAPPELGYLMIDNRANGAGLFEASTFTCTHCGAVVVMHPLRTRPRTKCHGCRHLICDACAAAYSQDHVCLTLAQKIEEQFEAVINAKG